MYLNLAQKGRREPWERGWSRHRFDKPNTRFYGAHRELNVRVISWN